MTLKLHRYVLLIAGLIVCCTGQPLNLNAEPLDLPNVPLEVSTAVPPNIIFLIDDSGSMNNIVPEAPYDANTTYFTCPAGITLAQGEEIDLWVSGSGSPYIEYDDTHYDWGTIDENGPNGFAKRCFDPAQSYSARLYANEGDNPQSADGYGYGQFTGNYLNWYFGNAPTDWGSAARLKPGASRRIDIAQTAAKSLVDTLNNVRVGIASFNGDDASTINIGVEDLTPAHKIAVKNVVDTLSPGGNTPLAESLQDIGRYFVQDFNNPLVLHPGDPTRQTTLNAYTVFDHEPQYASGVTQHSPIQHFCQQNFALLLTDGRPNNDQDISSSSGLQDYDGDCINADPACEDHDKKTNRTYNDDGSDYLDDVAKALYEMDLRPDLDDANGDEVVNNIITYTVGFADDQVINDPLMQDTANNGGGLFLTAENSTELLAALQTAFVQILGQASSLASVSLDAASLHANSTLYQTKFTGGDWTGQLLAKPIDPTDGSLQADTWDAQTQLDAQTYLTRKILTYDDASGSGIAFRWGSLSPAMQGLLNQNASGTPDAQGADRLNYLRGDNTHEGANNNYRSRSHVLGDFVHSAPYYVGGPLFPDEIGAGYNTFRTTYEGRTPIIYIGANDGLLHGFNATTGDEAIAYVPHAVFPHLNKLTDPAFVHRYYVDGAPTVGDAYGAFGSSRCSSGTSCWRSVLVSGLRSGGQGVFALDVTDSDTFSEAAGKAADIVLWEFTDADHADLGYTFSQPSIVRMANGKWAAVIGNGYNNSEADASASGNGHAVLYILFLDGGLDGTWTPDSDYIKIDTNQGSQATPNGLATPAVVDIDGDYTADLIYAGDLEGNLWKFDVRAPDPTQWNSPGAIKLFEATTSQPITTRPEVGIHPTDPDGLLVYFGTGKYLEQ
ncbi:MAG: PilC/PilY family type IV pilus protein, partial [Candidatus Tectomicrobia bacterium]|nr:PilC/PilY family type IV pilus protein [Candidatus Tectomicrobia bacterium]